MSGLKTSRTLAIGTSVRIAASPVVLGLMLGHHWAAATILFLLVAATDFLDGRLARRWQVTTKLGAFLDTTADKMLVSTALLGLLAVHRASPWVVLVIIGREFTIMGLRALVTADGSQFRTSMFGKWKATIQFVAIAVATVRPDVTFGGAYLDQWLMIATAIVTAWSGVDYIARSADVLRT